MSKLQKVENAVGWNCERLKLHRIKSPDTIIEIALLLFSCHVIWYFVTISRTGSIICMLLGRKCYTYYELGEEDDASPEAEGRTVSSDQEEQSTPAEEDSKESITNTTEDNLEDATNLNPNNMHSVNPVVSKLVSVHCWFSVFKYHRP